MTEPLRTRFGAEMIEVGWQVMTLRDYFAGQYIAGRAARDEGIGAYAEVAQNAYELADAMLKERVK